MTHEQFLDSYRETALWSSMDGDGLPLDDVKYHEAELSLAACERFRADCLKFESAFQKIVNDADYVSGDFPDAAHDFWLTRNRHGAGFWDGDYPEPLATQLTELAHSFGECELYVGDDGQIHV